MKRIFYAFLATALIGASPALAQVAVSGSGSSSESNANSASLSTAGAAAGVSIVTNGGGTSRIESAPAVSAPAVFGGGHPCLAGKSGGVSIIGGGVSYGSGDAEPICMLWLMNQPEAAIRLLAMQSPGACKAMSNVGYYRVGNQVIEFSCGKTVKGGIDTPGFTSRRSRVSTRNASVSHANGSDR